MMNVRVIALVFICSFGTVIAYEPRIISRSEWDAGNSTKDLELLDENPPPFVIIHYSTRPTCHNEQICKLRVKQLQNDHIKNKHWDDISYNFLVGEDGNVYEGRGWGKSGDHAPRYNSKSIGICVLGTYNSSPPNDAALNAVKNLIAWGASNGYISSDYKLFAHRQLRSTECPGRAFYNQIKTWDHWSSNRTLSRN